MSANKLISIILPVYNSEKYIEKCLNALISQTYSNIEILCINDGSTDNSLDILKKYEAQDNRIKVFSNLNSGPATSRNIGLEHATGEYLMFCDSDDTYEPQMCEKMLFAIESNDVDLAMCKARISYENGISRQGNPIGSIQIIPTGIHKISDMNYNKLSILLWHKIFKKSLVDKYNIRFPDGLESDDDVFCYEYFAISNNYYCLQETLYNYLVRKNSIMHKFYNKTNPEKLYDPINILKYFYNYLESNSLLEKQKIMYMSCFVRKLTYCWQCNPTKEAREEIISIALKENKYKKIPRHSLMDIIKTSSIDEIDRAIKVKTFDELVFGKIPLKTKIQKSLNLIKQYKKYYA